MAGLKRENYFANTDNDRGSTKQMDTFGDNISEDSLSQDELETMQKMLEAAQQKPVSEDYEYLVRGAVLKCDQGSHERMMNLPWGHGVYIEGFPAVHERDCKVGDYENITTFGVCESEGHPNKGGFLGGFFSQKVKLTGEDGKKVKGFPCQPHIVGEWRLPSLDTEIAENVDDPVAVPPEARTDYARALTTNSFLVCQFGGIIEVLDSGQDYGSNDIIAYDEEGEPIDPIAEEQEAEDPADGDGDATGEGDGGLGVLPGPGDQDAEQGEGTDDNAADGEASGEETPAQGGDTDEEYESPPVHAIQNKKHWCFATCAVLYADTVGWSSDADDAMKEYLEYIDEDKKTNRNYYTSTSSGVRTSYCGQYRAKGEKDTKYFCDPYQEFAVAIRQNNYTLPSSSSDVLSLTLGDTQGDAPKLAKYITGNSYTKFGDDNSATKAANFKDADGNPDMDKLNQLVTSFKGKWQMFAQCTPASGTDSHVWLVENVSSKTEMKENDEGIEEEVTVFTGMTLYDPMTGNRPVLTLDDLMDSFVATGVYSSATSVWLDFVYAF